jgi:hypothetical protein
MRLCIPNELKCVASHSSFNAVHEISRLKAFILLVWMYLLENIIKRQLSYDLSIVTANYSTKQHQELTLPGLLYSGHRGLFPCG